MNVDKRILVLVIIIAILAVGVAWGLLSHQNAERIEANNVSFVNNTTVKNATVEEEEPAVTNTESGQYGYCAICGKALTYAESQNDYTQGKVCHSCASNPYYQTGEGAQYANEKLAEAYPDEYDWMDDDVGDDYEYEDYDDTDYELIEDSEE